MKTDILLKIVIVILPIYLNVYKPTEAVEDDALEKGQKTRSQSPGNQMTASMLPLQERNKVALSKRETEDAENIPTLGSKPFISFEEDQTGGLTVTCTSEGWLPKPEVLWTDWNGDVLSKQAETELEMNDKGLFNIKSNIHTDAETLNGLSCVIKNNFLMKEQHSSPPKLERFLGLKLAKTIIGHFGKEVLLPCFFTLKTHPKNLEVSWVKTNFEKEIAIHSFTDGRITTETEGENFSSRTRLYKEELRHGNFSLRLMNVLLSDQGNYCCSVKTDKGIKRAFIQLYVASVGSNPFLSILSYQEETITFICKSQKWFPQPEVSWIGKDVQKFSDNVETKIEEDNEGLYQVKSVIVLQKDSITGLSCSIKNKLLTEEKHTASPHPGSFDVIGPSEPVFAFIGEDVLLPCLCTINYFNTQIFDVKWIKTEHKNTEEVYTFIRGEKFGRKGQNYRSRATLYNEEFEHGNVSLKLSNFQVANAGNYSCSVKSEHGIRDAVIQVITAGIGPRPFISIVDFQSEEIKLVCESLNWDSKPEGSWMDEKGQNMNAFSETFITENEEHLFNVQSYLTLRSSAVKQVYCNIRDQMGKEYNIPEEGDFAVLGPRNPIVGVLGEDVLLPCMLMAKKSPHHFEIRWIKTKFPFQSSVTVYSFRSGMNVVEQVDEHYQNQGQLHDDFLSTGNISMKLSSIQLSDSGNYTCIVHTEHGRKAAIIELKVAGLGSEPSLDITSYAEHTVTVSCKSKGWFPEPEILWITEKGEDLTGSSATSGECNENGLFTIQSSITVTKNSVQHLTCMVRNTWITNQKSNTTPVPDNFLIVRPKSPVIAVMGENITLPCELQPNVCPSDMILEWVKVESDNQVTVLNYKKGPSHCLSYTEDYTTRAFVSEEEFCRGSLSLQLRNTQLSDMGSYICSVKSGKIRSSAKIDVYITDKPSEDTVKPPPQGKQKDDASERDKKKKKEKVHPPPPVQDIDNDRRKKMIYSDCLFVLYDISIVVVPVIFAVLFFACIICHCCQKGRKKTLEDDVTEIEKSNMERELKALREQQDVAEKENKDMEKEIKTLHEQKEASEREKEHMEAEMKVLWKQKEAAESEEERMKAEMKRLCEQKDAAERDKKKMEAEMKTLHEQKDAALREKETMEQEMKTIHEQKDAALREKETMEQEMKTVHEQKDAALREKETMEQEIKTLRGQKDDAEREKKQMEAEIKTLHEQKDDAEREKKQMEAGMKTLREEKDAMEKDKKTIEKEMKTLHEEKDAIEKEKKCMETEMETLRQQKGIAERAKRDMETEMETLREEKDAVEAEKKNKETEMKKLLEEKEKEIKSMEAEMKTLREQKDIAERAKRNMETDAVDREKKNKETEREEKSMETDIPERAKKNMETGAEDRDKKNMEADTTEQDNELAKDTAEQGKKKQAEDDK